MLAAILALTGALVYGSADFLGGLAAKRLRSIVVTAVAAASGLALLCVLLPFIGGTWDPVDVAWGALAGVFGVLALVLLYACLAIGPMSILAPLTAVVSAIAPMLWGLLVGGEALSTVGYAGLAVALVAVVLVGFVPGTGVTRPTVQGLLMAIGSGAAIGAFVIAIDHTSPDSGVVPLVVGRATSATITLAIVGAIAFGAVRRGRRAASVIVNESAVGREDAPSMRPSRAWMFAVACGVVDAGANTMLLLALRVGDLSIVSALTAMYPAGTIVLAAVVLRERIAAVQWVGLSLALAAGVMLALA
ncbi:EamA family transporter [Microbacterium rhizomatis]|uniref:EamA family transporter n=1 Tax=Microbacterium rhizomatis TaxID=1631477 RepID=A0A5J5J2C3_9MICO|nr:EamA family transporter [Microbacterium rhizomatis]KAA9107563.1 EamA family transporter [Microbacterium rhizomatis]